MDKIRFSISTKLIIIFSIIMIVSLATITFLTTSMAADLLHKDLRRTAQDNSFIINRKSVLEAETVFAHVRSYSNMLMQTITGSGLDSTLAQKSTDFFFEENPQIAALFIIFPDGTGRLLVNETFFRDREIDTELVDSYFQNHQVALERSVQGEDVILNASPDFSTPLLALFFPWQAGGAVGTLFSSESLSDNFGTGLYQSYIINSDGDILVHIDLDLVRTGINIGNRLFIRDILESQYYTTQSQYQVGIRSIETERSFNPAEENATEMVRQYLAFSKLNTSGAVLITTINSDRVFEALIGVTKQNLILAIALLGIPIIIIRKFSKSISVPIKDLANAAHKIEDGNFEIELKPKGRDEVGLLTASFQRMSAALSIFGRFTNRDIAVKAMRGEIKPGGSPKNATIFFSDIREFTAMSENFTKTFGDEASDRIVHWLNEYLTQMVECVEKTSGVVDKFIGDAVMAHWGTAYTAGSPQEDAFNCIEAALMMRLALIEMNKRRSPGDAGNPPIRIGCGINTGIVTAGQIGSDKRMEYTVIGDPVNLASRTEALTKPLGADILITEDTWLLIGDKLITEEMPPVTVKGKEKPVRIFAVVNLIGASGPKTLSEVREILSITPPDISKVDVNAGEEKYKIGGE